MRDMTIIENKKIVNKETREVRQVVQIDEENRKIYTVPVEQPDAEPAIMAAATYDRRWTLYEESDTEANAEPAAPVEELAETEEPAPAEEPTETTAEEPTETPTEEPQAETTGAEETETPAEEPKKTRKAKAAAQVDPEEAMKMSETVAALEEIFDKLNEVYFEGELPRPVITVQTTPKAYGHCTTKKIWKSETEAQYEINLGAEFINRPKEQTCATLLHEMVHLFCNENEIADTCQNGRYHNKAFKTECEARDLAVEYDRANGYSHTAPTDAFKEKLTEAGVDLETPFAKLARTMPRAKAKAQREKAHKYVCPVCGQKVSTTAELNLICGDCNVPMERVD